MAKVIKFKLDAKSIGEAIKELEKYEEDIKVKTDILRKRLADELATEAQMLFNSAVVDDLITGGSRSVSVSVTVSESGDISIVTADGEDAVWVEFGAGVYHNGSVGSSPHPKGVELGYTIGSYGKGYGKGRAWGYYDNGELRITRGTPAKMPMYTATQSIINKAVSIAREVWK
jgi:hypothetical protein